MTFALEEWLGEWTSFETLIDGDDPYLNRAWAESDAALRDGKSPFRYILPFFGGSARRFWGWACRTCGREYRGSITGWRITPPPADDGASFGSAPAGSPGMTAAMPDRTTGTSPAGTSNAILDRQDAPAPHGENVPRRRSPHSTEPYVSCETSHETCRQTAGRGDAIAPTDDQPVFTLEWLGGDGEPIGRYAYRLDHMIDKGLEGKPCYVFHATDAPAGRRNPFAVLIAMDPMPSRAELADGGLLSHLHFQYASAVSKLLKGTGRTARLRRRMWYPTMCAAEGDLLARCNIVRALHRLPVWAELPH